MNIPTPHFLLFSETVSSTSTADQGGKWRFVLQPLNGKNQIEANDDEPGAAGDRLELLALVRGLEALDQPSQVTVLTRSRAIQSGIRFGIENWRENAWQWERFGQMTPVKNQDLWKRIDHALQIHTVICRAWKCDESDDLQVSGTAEQPVSPVETDTEIPIFHELGSRKLRIDGPAGGLARKRGPFRPQRRRQTVMGRFVGIIGRAASQLLQRWRGQAARCQ